MADISDTLAAIDSALIDRCGCGCGRPLDARGPSLHFATPDCQRRWHEDQTDNPHEVYRRPDAIVVGPSNPPEPQPVSAAAAHWLALWGFERAAIDDPIGWPAGGPEVWFYELCAYRRRCDNCGARSQPETGIFSGDAAITYQQSAAPMTLWYSRRASGEVSQRCPRCRATYDGPVLVGHVELTPEEIQLSLTDGAARVDDFITHAEMANGPHLCRVLTHTWSAMEDALAAGPGLTTWWTGP